MDFFNFFAHAFHKNGYSNYNQNARAKIFKAILFKMKSPIGLAKQRMTKKEHITAVIIIHLLFVNPTAVITESREKTTSKIIICDITQ